ncbi:tRNA (guanosine(46)-N7)-methyltransferase TrmB [Terasakiispira papahanaumokuakeensis]|uniref:tRNA (guanine-N(7)-)-methyltransferase n=1 Tax=Terasakiispira papahanaumokuakeensis TaxID=197479 RepID=A0A1E2VCI3_9GAMM|nr:tRNA (guanosine(46)-N7)-methyltransferase TrmB [Terasakiispira papahanaumokuakeensis]ODC04709.1 tRNA (guanosine(46)-N7)-methyltransferase TrmB [Terasakiispira papahanaumokuakeensis]
MSENIEKAFERADNAIHDKRIRSYVLRQGRMTAAQQRGIDNFWPQFGLSLAQGPMDQQQVFGREAPLVVEIGFGMGASLLAQAMAMPDHDFIGIEVHQPGVGKLLQEVGDHGLTNVRVYQDDAVEVLNQCIPAGTVELLQLFFPDPWTKKKHHKRRIVQPPFVQTIRQSLKIGGRFHMATDWGGYAEHMRDVMDAAEGFTNTAEQGDYVPRPESRPLTKFEQRGEKLGHDVWDLIYRRTA